MSAGAPGLLGPPADRPLKYLFVVGCPRSGTTWLQLLLSQHPGVATSQETHLFSRYVSRLDQGWRFEHDVENDRRRNTGLASVLSSDEFYAICRDFAARVLDRILERKPGAHLVLEKTPAHVRHAPLIQRLFPHAYFLHVVRDPRSVVSSLRAAGKSWGRHWAPTSPPAGAYLWRSDVTAGTAIGQATERYRELRYETLAADAAGELGRICEWLELPADDSFCRDAVAACDIDRLRAADGEVRSAWSLRDEPDGFYRKGAVSGWAQELSAGEVAVIEHIAGPLMERFGYERVTTSRRRRPFRLAARDALKGRLARTHRWLGVRVGAL